MKLSENPGYGTICRGPFGTLWECQARGTDGQVVIPVDVAWTGHGVEWRPAKGGAR